jgi:predicted nucleic acid-binding protein
MKRIFVDTAGWMAMADAKDPEHRGSISYRDRALEDGAIMVTSNYIIDETLTLIKMRLGIGAAEKWWGIVSRSPRCQMEWITPQQAERSLTYFFRWKDQSFSFTDCTSFVLMKELSIQNALTTDSHFLTAGFVIYPQSA